jgi:hypothetical protein
MRATKPTAGKAKRKVKAVEAEPVRKGKLENISRKAETDVLMALQKGNWAFEYSYL